MISATGTPFSLVPLALNGAQPSADPAVQRREDVADAVFEVFPPPAHGPVDLPHDVLHRAGSVSPGLVANGLFVLVQTLRSRPSVASLEVVAQKVEAPLLARLHDARLGRVQDQSRLRHPLTH